MFTSGTLIRALKSMRAWSNDQERGYDGPVIEPGAQALVLQTWMVGEQVRIRVMANDTIMLFSNPKHTVSLNWEVLSEAKATPSGT